MENEPGTNKYYLVASLLGSAKEIRETFCLSPELIRFDTCQIPQSMLLIATLANGPNCQIMIVLQSWI